jgi:hypothetical protein
MIYIEPVSLRIVIVVCIGVSVFVVKGFSQDAVSVNVREFGAIGNGVADDTGPIQSALHSGKSTVEIGSGIYKITRTLKIRSNTHLKLAPNAVIRRAAGVNAMIINETNGSGGHDGSSNIKISGGVWDGNSNQFGAACTLIAVGHARDVEIRDTAVINIPEWHGIELSATLRAQVIRVRFDNCNNEALQLDTPAPQSTGTFPWFGPYDDTKNRDILIAECTFTNVLVGIGSHSNPPVESLSVERCLFVGTKDSAIKAAGYDKISVEECDFFDCARAYSGASKALTFRGNRVIRSASVALDLRGVLAGIIEGNKFVAGSIGMVNVGALVTVRDNFYTSEQSSALGGGRVANISIRTLVTGESPTIVGIAVAERRKSVLIRVAGPALRQFSVNDALSDPWLGVRDSSGRTIAESRGWDAALSNQMLRNGAFPFQEGSGDVAMLQSLDPGLYSIEIRSASNTSGTILVEVYDIL